MSTFLSVDGLDKHFENKLRLMASGFGGLMKELFKEVGKDMTAEAKGMAQSAFNSRSGKLLRAIKFIPTDNGGVFTTKTSLNEPLNKAKTFYASFIERGTVVRKPRNKKYLVFKIDGQWKKVPSVSAMRSRPFMQPVADEYFGDDNAKGYRKIAAALEKMADKELGK
jgi:hypothetical protein